MNRIIDMAIDLYPPDGSQPFTIGMLTDRERFLRSSDLYDESVFHIQQRYITPRIRKLILDEDVDMIFGELHDEQNLQRQVQDVRRSGYDSGIQFMDAA